MRQEQESPYSFCLLPGDGIGPEIIDVTESVMIEALEAFEIPFRITRAEVGFPALEHSGTTMPQESVECANAADAFVLGPVSHLDYPSVEEGGVNPSGYFRKEFDLFANVRPARTFTGVEAPSRSPFDLVIVRENTEGFYADRTMFAGTGEVMPTPDLALAYRKVTRRGSERIAEVAFEIARMRNSNVTAVHKQNVLRVSDGLFLEAVHNVASRFPDVGRGDELIDAMVALLIRDPTGFDVIVTTNMFGDILSDAATELAGGLGMAASLNYGDDHLMAQAQHGSAPSLAGTDRANPLSLVLSSSMMLVELGRRRNDERLTAAGTSVDLAVVDTLRDPVTRTGDIGGTAGTQAVGAAVVQSLKRGSKR